MTTIAILGTGSIAHEHVAALRQTGRDIAIAACADPDLARAQQFAALYQIPHAYASPTDLLGAHRLDCVHVCSPPDTHIPLSIASMAQGCWVLCEKPICGTLAQLDALQAVEAQTGCCIASVLQYRFGPSALHLKRLIDQGELGALRVGMAQTLWFRSPDYYAVDWRSTWARSLGGVTLTLGIHQMDMLLWLVREAAGDWVSLHAHTATLNRSIELENVSMAVVRMANGALLNITNSALSPREETTMRLDFDHATVELRHLYRYDETHWTYTHSPLLQDTGDRALERWRTLPPARHATLLADQFEAFYAAFDLRQRPPVDTDSLRPTMEFLTALYKSAATDSTVRRGTLTPDDAFYHALTGAPPTAD